MTNEGIGESPNKLWSFLLAMVAAVCCLTDLAAKTVVWTGADVAHSPAWSNGLNWDGDQAPSAGDTASFPATLGNVEILVGDSDIDFVNTLKTLSGTTLQGPRIVFGLSTNFTFAAGASSITLVKRGNNEMYVPYCVANYQNVSTAGFEVEAGLLRLPQLTTDAEKTAFSAYWTIGALVVSNGATTVLANAKTIGKDIATVIPKVHCAGTISNVASNGVKLRIGNIYVTEENPNRFTESAAMSGNISLEICGPVVIDTDNLDFTSTLVRLGALNNSSCQPVVTLKKIGMKADVASSIGQVGSLRYLYNGGTWRYAGEGETTDKELDFAVAWYNYSPYRPTVVDAGAHGGVTFTGKWSNDAGEVSSSILPTDVVLTGSNTVPCVLANQFSARTGYPMSITKRGTGSWRFNDHAQRNFNGFVAVEEGKVQFESLAEQGQVCSLGTASLLQERYSTTFDPARNSPWAMLLGTTNASGAVTSEGALEHVGSMNAASSTRPLLLVGNGRLTANAGLLSFGGVTSAGGVRTLTIDGDNEQVNLLSCVTGAVSLVKEGSSTWKLADGVQLGGTLTVKAGTLLVEGPGRPYRWYRFTVRETMNSRQASFDELSLFSSDGVRQNLSLVCDSEAYIPEATGYVSVDVDVPQLEAGHANYAYDAQWWFYKNRDFEMKTLWNGKADTLPFLAWNINAAVDSQKITVDHPERRVSVVFRLPDNAPEITRYDFASGSSYSGYANTMPKIFELEGSLDGSDSSWQRLHYRDDQPASAGAGLWASDGTAFNTAYTNVGFAVKGHTEGVSQLSGVTSISVSTGAVLRAIGVASRIRGLTVTQDGIGTIDGFAFEENTSSTPCTLDVSGVGKAPVVELGGSFANCTGLENLAQWNLSVNGKVGRGWVIEIRNGRIVLVRKGFAVIIK